MKFPDLSRGLCREIGVDFFYPDDGGDASNYKLARTICSGCGVKDICLEWAVAHESHGMWGGTTPRERAAIRRRLGITVQEIYVREYT